MGLFWDLMQHNQINEQAERSTNLEERVQMLEGELAQTRQVLLTVIERLEKHVGTDLDGDGRVG